MTFADDLIDEKDGLGEGGYPSAFGITFTPMISGIAVAVLGIVGAGYIFMTMVKPAQEKYQKAAKKQQEVKAQLEKIKTGDLQLKLDQLQGELAAKKVLKSRVTAMFTNENDLKTLLLDLNNFVAVNEGLLIQYQPDSGISTVQDTSLGAEVKGKLKRKGIALTIEGTFNQTKAILRDLERLQPLLVVKNISSTVNIKPTAILTEGGAELTSAYPIEGLTSSQSEIVPQKEAELKTQIRLDAILPFSQEELEAAQKTDEEAEKQDKKSRREKRREERKNNSKK